FFLQFFPRAEQERLKREYHSIRQTSLKTSTEFMQRFLRLARFLGAAAGTEEEQAKNFQWGVVTGVTVRISTVTNLTGEVVVTTIAATTTTLATS
nr:zinc finger, CCHC-type, retrotransposon Gag domain protein [Tanacetum cinerariifolium]